MTARRTVLGSGNAPPNAFVGGTATRPVQTSLPIAGERSQPVAPAQMPEKRQRTPGTLMSPLEWIATAAVRRILIERMSHLAWSRLTDIQRDEAVREAVRNGL